MKKQTYKIFHDGHDWIATTTEFRRASGCASTPKEALKELMSTVVGMREVMKEDRKKGLV